MRSISANIRVLGTGEIADALRDALAQLGLYERAGVAAALVCTVDDLSHAITMPELAQAAGPLVVVMTEDPAAAIEAGADDAGATPNEVARRVTARLKVAPRAARQMLDTPVEEDTPEPPLTGPGRRPLPSILVVEDDEDTRAILEEFLRERYDVEGVGDGESALKRAQELVPDLVLLDLFLPGLDGFGVLTGLRRDRRTAEVPVIFLSAEGDTETKSQGLSRGADDYLAKGCSARELMARVDRSLKLAARKEHFRALAQTDGLTGLPNFRSFHARLEEEVARADRYEHPLACAMVDLDGLKEINDRLGHGAGNRAIIALADAVREALRETDFAARYGGDEFVVLLPQTSAQAAGLFAERLRRRLLAVSDETGLPVRASIGIAALSANEMGSQDAAGDLLRRADEQLYEAKHSGRERRGVPSDGASPEGCGRERPGGSRGRGYADTSKPLTDEELTRLRRMESEMPAAPWRWWKGQAGSPAVDHLVLWPEEPAEKSLGTDWIADLGPAADPRRRATAASLIAIRNELPRLLDEIKRLRGENEPVHPEDLRGS
jgi:two-component system cell cycle response regulator